MYLLSFFPTMDTGVDLFFITMTFLGYKKLEFSIVLKFLSFLNKTPDIDQGRPI